MIAIILDLLTILQSVPIDGPIALRTANTGGHCAMLVSGSGWHWVNTSADGASIKVDPGLPVEGRLRNVALVDQGRALAMGLSDSAGAYHVELRSSDTNQRRFIWPDAGKCALNASMGLATIGDQKVKMIAIGYPGAEKSSSEASQVGRVEVYDLSDGKLLRTIRGEGPSFGSSLFGISDIDQDGVADLVIASPKDDNGRGTIAVIPSRSGGKPLVISSKTASFAFGSFLTDAGDWNGDSVNELLVSAPCAVGGRPAVELVDPAKGVIIRTYVMDIQSKGLLDCFVSDACVLGDLNGDQCPEVLLACGNASGDGKHSGVVEVLSGKDGTLIGSLNGESEFDHLGICVCRIGQGSQVLVAARTRVLVLEAHALVK